VTIFVTQGMPFRQLEHDQVPGSDFPAKLLNWQRAIRPFFQRGFNA